MEMRLNDERGPIPQYLICDLINYLTRESVLQFENLLPANSSMLNILRSYSRLGEVSLKITYVSLSTVFRFSASERPAYWNIWLPGHPIISNDI